MSRSWTTVSEPGDRAAGRAPGEFLHANDLAVQQEALVALLADEREGFLEGELLGEWNRRT